jgi:AraC family transcriptional regulator
VNSGGIVDHTMTLFIRNMVCDRCIRVVREELEKLGLKTKRIELGEAEIVDTKRIDLGKIQKVLQQNGFELIEDKKVRIIERVKLAVLRIIQQDQRIAPLKLNYSEYLARELGHDYHYLSSLFSSLENITIEQFIILQKIERVKELLKYGELTLSEIAFALGYSSVQHLSSQFKKITGFTPSTFKDLKKGFRKPLDHVAA